MFLLPLTLSLVGALFFALTAEAGPLWKILAVVLALGAAYMEFFTGVPLFVPVLIQVALCIWFVLHWKIDQMRS